MTSRSARESYRHGAVRAEAIAAAYAQVEACGHELVSLRRVADALGIVHRSLYNHFDDREALLDAVAERGFIALAGLIATARGRDDFVRLYLTFALENRRLHALMASRPRERMAGKPTLQRAAQLCIDAASRVFARPDRADDANRRATLKGLMLLNGALAMHASGALEFAGDDNALIAELQAMLAQGL
jgi:AcrR family transcriptional regulator